MSQSADIFLLTYAHAQVSERRRREREDFTTSCWLTSHAIRLPGDGAFRHDTRV